jgi:hypothetical protein
MLDSFERLKGVRPMHDERGCLCAQAVGEWDEGLPGWLDLRHLGDLASRR